MPMVKVYYQKCPDCGQTWSAQLSETSVIRIGREVFACKCGNDWSTGRVEWAHLTPEQRQEYFFSTAEIGVMVISTIFPALFGYFVGSKGWHSALIAGLWGGLVGLVICSFLWLMKMFIVWRSLRRLPHAETGPTGYWPWEW